MVAEYDDRLDRMPWVPPMPGNKTYVLREAQKEIERLRQEIRRLRFGHKGFRDGIREAKEPQENEEPTKPQGGTRERDAIQLRIGDDLVVLGVIKILGQS